MHWDGAFSDAQGRVFDRSVTGFKFDLQGVQEEFEVILCPLSPRTSSNSPWSEPTVLYAISVMCVSLEDMGFMHLLAVLACLGSRGCMAYQHQRPPIPQVGVRSQGFC